MPTLIDRYLLEIETNQDGLWTKIRKFFELNKIKHPKYKKIIDVINRDVDHCKKTFPAVSIGFKIGKFSYDSYKDNPKFVLCYLLSQISGIKKIKELLDTTPPEELCSQNYNKERCLNYINELKEDIPFKLEQLEREFQLLKGGKASEDKFNKFVKRLI